MPGLLIAALSLAINTESQSASDPWFSAGRQSLQQALHKPVNKKRARNIIVFLGDGMSLATINAARIYQGQLQGHTGEENRLSFETFPYTGLVKTYNTDALVPDSAGTMSAIMTGVKTKSGIISLDDGVAFDRCDGPEAHYVKTILEIAADLHKSTGVVTTTRLTHATPAATYSHSANREWESDHDLSEEAKAKGCADIAAQFMAFHHGDGIQVALGGGRSKFLPNTEADPEYADKKGERADGRNLISEWQGKYPQGKFVWNREQFNALNPSTTKRVLGLFEPSHMQYESQRDNEPSLSEMTEKSIRILQRNHNGFFLMVEGGRIDHAHHAGNARNALNETLEFAKAIEAAVSSTSSADTLIVVTADHGHAFTMAGGYARRGNPVLGLVQNAEASHDGEPVLDTDLNGKPFTLLNYVNGPGFGSLNDKPRQSEGRADLHNIDTTAWLYRQEAMIPMSSETHSGEDVAVYASGPWAHLFTGSMEQNVLFHYMAYAAGM